MTPDPVCIATEGALWGSVMAHDFLRNGVIVKPLKRTYKKPVEDAAAATK